MRNLYTIYTNKVPIIYFFFIYFNLFLKNLFLKFTKQKFLFKLIKKIIRKMVVINTKNWSYGATILIKGVNNSTILLFHFIFIKTTAAKKKIRNINEPQKRVKLGVDL